MKEMRIFQKQTLFIILTGLIYSAFAQDHYKNKIVTDASNGFTVEYFETYKVLTNLITNEKYALVCCNQSLANFTSGYYAAVNTPLTNVGVDTELDSLPFFELLGLSGNVKAASPSANVTSPCFAGISDGPNSTTTMDAIFTAKSNNAVAGTKPQYISVSTGSTTLTPIQQSAWIIYIAHFFEQEAYGNQIWGLVTAKYNCHRNNLASAGSKNIAWTTYDVLNKAWTLHFNQFTNTLIQDAGMKLIAPSNQSTVYQNLTDFQNALSNVDFVIDDSPASNFKTDFAYGDWLTAGGFTPSSPESFISSKNVFRTDRLVNPNGYSDWPIRHSARADLAISDVVHMVYNTYEPTYNMTWFRAFAQMGDSIFVSNISYPSCTSPVARIDVDVCSINPFKPNSTVNTTPQKPANPSSNSGLSTGGKVGVAVGVVVGVAAVVVISTFAYRRRSFKQKEGTFVKMNDM